MPLILPNPDNFVRSTPGANTQIIAPSSVTPRDDFSGDLAVGRALSKLSDDIDRVTFARKQRIESLEYTRATTAFKISNIKSIRAFSDDNDYSTYDKRYSEGVGKARDKLSETISSPELRERFTQESMLGIARGRDTMAGKAFAMERDFHRAELSDSSEMIIEAYVGSDNDLDRDDLVSRFADELALMQENRYISAQDREALADRFMHDIAQGRIGSMGYREQLAVIKEDPPWLQGLSIKERRAIKMAAGKVAAIEDFDDLVIETTDRILSSGGSYEEQIKKSNSIKNSDVRSDVQKAINRQYQQQSKIRSERERGAQNQGFEIYKKGGEYEHIPATTRFEMGSAKANQLKQIFEDRGKAPPRDQDSFYAELTVQGAKDSSVYGTLTDADIERNIPQSRQVEVKKLQKEATEGRAVTPATDGSLQSLSKSRVPDLLGHSKPPKSVKDITRANAYHREFDKRIDAFRVDSGKLPTREQGQEIIDKMLFEVKIDPVGWWSEEDRAQDLKAFEVDPDQYGDIVSVPEDFQAKLLSAYHQRFPGKSLSQEMIMQKFVRYLKKTQGN